MLFSRHSASSLRTHGRAIALLLSAFAAVTGCSTGSSSGSSTPTPTAPSITTQPTAQSAYVGDTATFSVAASGSSPITYQWMRGGTAISGTVGVSYTTPALALTDDGAAFSVSATNSAGTATSAAAKLSVSAKPASITANPADTAVTDGSSATFSVMASGTGPLSYQWMRGGAAIAGATSATYTFAGATIADSGSLFSVKVSNSAATVTSTNAKLTVNPAPVVLTTQPAGATQFVGETATFSVAATGTSPTYQWRRNAAAIGGATSATYTTAALAAADDNTTYDVLVSNAAGSVTSSAATLRVGPFATSYTTQKGVVLNLYAWPGAKNAILTQTATLDAGNMRKVLAAADGTWNYYAGADGALPSYFKTYNGLATIAVTGVGGVDLCGDGCTYIGATGMELSNNAWSWLYTGVANNQYDQVMFYEFGRSFWLFGSKLEYKSPSDSSCEVTGFAVLMRYRSLQAQGLTGLFGGSASAYTNQYNNTLPMIDTYAANASLNFNNTFLTNSFSSPYGGCSDLWTSMVLRLAQNYGGETFIQNLFKEVLKRPATTTTQDAIDNFVLAASAAAGKNLTTTFGTTWKWPISTAASNEATSKYGPAQ